MAFTDKEFIANKIREYRKKAGLTQTELAEKIGLGEKQISKVENYTNMPSLPSFLKIIEELKIDISEFGISTTPNNNPRRKELEKLLYSLSDSELEFYLETIKFMKKKKYLLENK